MRLRFHGGFDWNGVATANLLLERCRVQPWRMGAADYAAAVTPGMPQLTGRPVSPTWDRQLGAVMTNAGRAVPEEQVLPELLDGVRAELL